MQLRARIVPGYIGKRPSVLQDDFSVRARHHVVAAHYHKRGRRWFDQSLQAIPARRWNAAQFFRWIQNEIEDDEWEISVAQKKIGRLDRFGCFRATDPKQMLQHAGVDRLDIERIATIDEGEKKAIALCDMQQAVNEQRRARARIWADDFSDRAFTETAIGRSIKKRNTDFSARKVRR